MKNYILHIGLPKTGTKALQKECFDHLNPASICYNPPLIFRALTEMLKLIDFDMETEKDIRLLKDVIASEEEKISHDTILISHEILSQRLGKFDYRKRADFLKSIFPDATIVMILRYQPDLLRSLYIQFLQQNYLLKHNEVFNQNELSIVSKTEKWRTTMLIDIKQWNYTEAVQYFKSLYGDNFHVFFYENFPNAIELGKEILTLKNIKITTQSAANFPRINISYDAKIIRLMFFICYFKVAFKSNRGINSLHMKDLMDQANQARFNFNADGVENFLLRLQNPNHISKDLYSPLDSRIRRVLTKLQSILVSFSYSEYKLPTLLMKQLERDAKKMNASLHKVIDNSLIPKQYL